MTEADPDGPGPLASPVTTFAYDGLGNLLAATDALGSDELPVRRHGPPACRDDPLGGVASWTYDAEGNVLSMVDELSRTIQSRYDVRDRLVEFAERSVAVTRLEYDVDDNLISLPTPSAIGRSTRTTAATG